VPRALEEEGAGRDGACSAGEDSATERFGEQSCARVAAMACCGSGARTGHGSPALEEGTVKADTGGCGLGHGGAARGQGGSAAPVSAELRGHSS
jgi:hypothetical protein